MRASWLLLLACAGCATQYQPMSVNPKSGYLTQETSKGEPEPANKAKVSITLQEDLSRYQGRMLVTSSGILAAKTPFLLEQMTEVGAFTDTLDENGLQQRIIAAGVQDKVTQTRDLLGLNQAYRAYKPFLWAHFEVINKDGDRYAEMVVTEPGNGQDLFKAAVVIPKPPTISGGGGATDPDTSTDQDTWYPLFNSFIDWAAANGAKPKSGKAGSAP
jgi:hypothetical protein